MTQRRPIPGKVPGLRQRQRADGSWRVWWEPNAGARALGFDPAELDAARPTWSVRQAQALNQAVDRRRSGDMSAPAGPGGRTMSALIHAYRRDSEFLEKKPKTRQSYDRNLRIIDEKWGRFPVAGFTKQVMREWYKTCRVGRGETQAVRLIGMASILFSFAELEGWRAEGSNPCFRLKMSIPKGRARVASWDELDAILDAATTTGLASIGTAALLSALQGQRATDIVAATCGLFAEIETGDGRRLWSWKVDRSKRGNLGMMQLHPIVLDRVLPLIDGRAAGDRLLIEERLGRPYDEDLFQRRWREVRAAAADLCPSIRRGPRLQFRDLRRTFAVWAKSGGASDDDVGDVLGNTAALDPRLQETYMPPSFDTASRAVLSIARPAKDKTRRKA